MPSLRSRSVMRRWVLGGVVLLGIGLILGSQAGAVGSDKGFPLGVERPLSFTIALPAPEASGEGPASPRSAAESEAWPPRVGYTRELPASYRGDLAPRLQWTNSADGSLVATLHLRSPGAQGLRVALKTTLREGELRFFSPTNPTRPSQWMTRTDLLSTSVVGWADATWSPFVLGDTLAVEVRLPSAAALRDFRLSIEKVSPISTIGTNRVCPTVMSGRVI